MEPIDVAFERFGKIVDTDLPQYGDTIVSEADVRTKLIDRIFVEVLGWPYRDIHLETPAGKGFIDYRCTISNLNRLIIEAKRQGRDLGITEDRAGRFFKLNGPVFDSPHAKEGIEQAIRYCGHKNAELACVTNGRQWIIFLGNRRGDGKDTLEGQACVFGNLDGVGTNFKKFYDLLAYESVAGYRFRAEFQEAEGQPARSTGFNAPVRTPESRKLLPADKLYADLDRVMISFFRDLTGDDDSEMRKNCFVTTNESDRAESTIARISEELRNKVRTLKTAGRGETSEITRAITRIRDMRKHELVLLVGTKGAGKSTFIDRFFEDVLPKDVARDCVLVRIDLSESGADEHSIIRWLDEHFLDTTEKAVFGDRQPDYDDLKGMYFREYERLQSGAWKHTYDDNPIEFNKMFGEHIERRREERPHEYILHMLHRIVNSDHKVPCLIFDNADHFSIDFQEKVFQYAHSFFKEVLCLVMVPITDKTSWQLSRQGALQSFFTESFFLPSPPPDIILRKRIEYIEKKIKDDETPERGKGYKGYFFNRGIDLTIDNLRAFTSSVQAVFINTGEVATWIGNLANHDIRRCLQLTRAIIGSPHIQVDEMFKAIYAKSSLEVDPINAKLAIIRGKYDIYPTGQNPFVQNIFALTTEFSTSPLLGLRILQLLEDTHFQQAEGEARYVELSHIVEYCNGMYVDQRATQGWLDNLLKSGLILSYDPRQESIDKVLRVEIAPSGYQHLVWGRTDWAYLEAMLEVTPLLEKATRNELAELMSIGLPYARRKAIQLFLLYLIDEDHRYCVIPDHPQYNDQRKLTERLNQQVTELARPARTSHATRFGRPFGVVINWVDEHGYGFIAPEGGGRTVFIHICDIMNISTNNVPTGTLIEYEKVETAKGPKAVNAAIIE